MLALNPLLVLLQYGKSGLEVMHVVVEREILMLFVLEVIEFFLEGGDQGVFVNGFGCLFGRWTGSVHRVVNDIYII